MDFGLDNKPIPDIESSTLDVTPGYPSITFNINT